MNPRKIAELVWKFIGRALTGPRTVTDSVRFALVSTAELLLGMIGSHYAKDIKSWKKQLLRSRKAKSDAADAEAQRKMAEAVEAANKATRAKRPSLIDKAEAQLKLAEAAKTNAEAHALLMDAETRRIKEVTDAKARLIEAVGRLRGEGGEVFFNESNLREIMRSGAADARPALPAESSASGEDVVSQPKGPPKRKTAKKPKRKAKKKGNK